MSQAVETNTADMARILATLFQVGPPQLWGEPFHRSGLFALAFGWLRVTRLMLLRARGRVLADAADFLQRDAW